MESMRPRPLLNRIDDSVLAVAGASIKLLEHRGVRIGCNKSAPQGHPYLDMDPRQIWARRYLSWRFLRGEGIEIGALHCPLPLYKGARARYVDFMSVEDARTHYPELAQFQLVTPDYIENGEDLPSIKAESQDFIVANHFIEHCEDPIKTIANLLRRVRKGGVLFLAVPMRDFTFDRTRTLTPLDHIISDYKLGADASRIAHYREWAEHVLHKQVGEIDDAVNDLLARHYSIHFHVWNFQTFHELLEVLRSDFKFPFDIVAAAEWRYNPFESVYVLRRNGDFLVS